MKEFLLLIERHKELADLMLKILGGVATAVAGGWIAWKYFADRRDARLQGELNLRREAYFEYFSSIPLQMAAIGAFYHPKSAPLVIVPEAVTALHKLHLLAGKDALKCLVERNSLIGKGVARLNIQKKIALDFDGIKELFEQNKKSVVASAEAQQYRDGAWGNFYGLGRALIAELSGNYRLLLPLARKEIALDGDMTEILAALEIDQQLALEALDTVSTGLCLEHGIKPVQIAKSLIDQASEIENNSSATDSKL